MRRILGRSLGILVTALLGGCGRASMPPQPFALSGTCLHRSAPPLCYTPQQLRAAYDIDPLLHRGITGKGRTIVVLGVEGATTGRLVPFDTVRRSLHWYDHIFGIPDPAITKYAPFGGRLTLDAAAEAIEDLEMAHAVAPGAAIRFVLPNDGASRVLEQTNLQRRDAAEARALLQAIHYAVQHDLGDVMSISYATREDCVPPGLRRKMHALFAMASAQRITVVAGSGDGGALAPPCALSAAALVPGVSLPAADPLVTAVGGTELRVALPDGRYRSETAWREQEVSPGGNRRHYRFFEDASGGGISAVYGRPAYQDSLRLVGSHRGVPDVAFDAAGATGAALVIRSYGRTTIASGDGTSLGAPAWAGIAALADQDARRRIGVLNPCLYRIGRRESYHRAFHDVTQGSDTVEVGAPGRRLIRIQGFRATAGWDAVTGWGTPKTAVLVPFLAGCEGRGGS